MTDNPMDKVYANWKQELVKAGEIQPDEDLSNDEIAERYNALQSKKVMGALMGAMGGQGQGGAPQGGNPMQQLQGMLSGMMNEMKEQTESALKAAGFAPGKEKTAGNTAAKKQGNAAGPSASEAAAKPLEGVTHALERFLATAKGGNYCMLVVDGCWINFRLKARAKELYVQVAGDKYIPAKSHLQPEHVKQLEEFGITAEQGSDDIFSAAFKVEAVDVAQLVKDTFQIFNDVLRVNPGASAYVECVLGSKLPPGGAAVLDEIAEFLPDRRENNKFYWKWG